MDRAAPGDGQHPVFLLVIQVAMKDYVAPNHVQHDVFLFLALLAVPGVDPLVAELDGDPLQGPSLSPGVQDQGHGGSSTQSCQQQLVGIGTQSVPIWRRLVGYPGMGSGGHHLLEVLKAFNLDCIHRVPPLTLIEICQEVRQFENSVERSMWASTKLDASH